MTLRIMRSLVKKSIYNSRECLTHDSKEILMEIERLLNPLMKSLHKQGYKIRDISHLVSSVASRVENCVVLEEQLNFKEKEK